MRGILRIWQFILITEKRYRNDAYGRDGKTWNTEKVDVFFLEVRESNDAARRLYEKMKYKQIGIRKRFYGRPVEDAIVMSKMYTEGNIC